MFLVRVGFWLCLDVWFVVTLLVGLNCVCCVVVA